MPDRCLHSPSTIRNHTTAQCSDMDSSTTSLLVYFLYHEQNTGTRDNSTEGEKDIEDVSSELKDGDKGFTAWMKRP
ncbi:hypothetical protein TNCV_4631261 [Trichonephila clavipes]|nr:hypothetical protein TNCV_4631261 [Trichonephila clavipes]